MNLSAGARDPYGRQQVVTRAPTPQRLALKGSVGGGWSPSWLLFFLVLRLVRGSHAMAAFVVLLPILCVALFVSIRRRRQASLGERAIEMDERGVRLYKSSWLGDRPVSLAWTDVQSVSELSIPVRTLGSARPPLGFLQIVGPSRSYAIAEKSLRDPTKLHDFVEEAHLYLAALPDGVARQARSRAEEAETRAIFARPVRVVGAVAAACVAGYVAPLAMRVPAANLDPFVVARLGANVPSLVRAGEVYRLVSSSFLHTSFVGLVVGLLSLFVLGFAVERLLGSSRVAIVMFVSAVAGAAVAASFGHGLVTSGISTATFGLLGALGTMQYLGVCPAAFRGRRGTWIFVAVANAGVPLFTAAGGRIDWEGHLTATLVGALVTLGFVGRRASLAPPSRLSTGIAVAMGLLSICALGRAAIGTDSRASHLAMLQDLATQKDPPVTTVNDCVWYTAIDPSASAAEIAVAHGLSQQHLETIRVGDDKLGGLAPLVDTAIVMAHRAGDDDAALDLVAHLYVDHRTTLNANRIAKLAGNAHGLPHLAAPLTESPLARTDVVAKDGGSRRDLHAYLTGDALRPLHLVFSIARQAPGGVDTTGWILDVCRRAPEPDVELIDDVVHQLPESAASPRLLFAEVGCPADASRAPEAVPVNLRIADPTAVF